ncbi:MAG: hypothetical protein WA746_08265, partial [Isosphaeraceae bacterium]
LPPGDLITPNSSGSQITATYSAVTKQITIDNVVAGLHGGFGTLDGKIISTNPQGSINFKDGLGNVSINNQTGIPIVVQTIDTGSPASSTLDITDTDKFGSQEQTLYVYQPGSPIQEYTGQAGVTLGSGTPSATVSGTSASYDPEAGARWTWEDTASLYRTQTTLFSSEDVPTLAYNGDTSALPSDWLSAWGWGTPGNPNTNQNPWTVSNAGVSTTSGISDDTALSETISGTVPAGTLPTSIPSYTSQPPVTSYNENSSVVSWTPFEYNNNFGFNNFGSGTNHKNWWNYVWPLQASLTLTNSVKADYPIAIDFSDAQASGTGNITSNAPVYLTGTITQDVGQTSITAQGSITQASGASIEAKNLTLTAADGIGSTSQPLVVNLAAGGVLNAQSGNAGVYLNLNSGANIAQITSGDAADGYGDVVITASGDLLPESGLAAGTVNVTGDNITLTSTGGEVGNPASPLVIQANSVPAANGGVVGGVVNVTAQGDVGLVQNSGDLLVGTIQSTGHGAVAVSAPGGSILNAATWVAGGLSLAQAEAEWQALGLTDAAASQQSVTAFENQVNANYQQYWQLLGNGTVQNRSFTVGAGTQAVWNNATGGSFTLSTTVNGQTVTTAPIAFNANAAVMQTALAPLLGGTLTVTGSGTQADPWLISATGLGPLTANDSQLTRGVTTLKPVPLGPQQVWTSATGGTFTLSAIVNGQIKTTGPIDYNASAAALQTALSQVG